ncbi:Glu/Leu/Phe/Val dehydrogenase dimerization domain-containing protein [Sphaerisporangium sp. TRM90804]|uniref:Glu/Leu/Phe/Val dehydrogenase dimerization domain-containing protein n=1 Tax=Sphaerisporangium sp. TRM90804 TaxID=3031113 RepID=UPI002447FD8B|nr:Glu/Leu/Phe/Val dehydrogenase dimerization domain-containing protein [Sphaerisporangium sp. TRM90804]MDH2428037.1 Glu/Leu/Phe/Val dehydrogenase dimerization domain-containing protein [Sphaerisporangium sp. TRM90804]
MDSIPLQMDPGANMPRVIEYVDPIEGCTGYLVYDGENCRLAAGGFRVQPGLTAGTLTELASRMTLKQRVLGINVDGAKSGLAFDPNSPAHAEVQARFLSFLSHELTTRYSMGCDMGTRFEELEAIAASVGVPSVKYAVKHAQEFDDEEYFRRMALLDATVGGRTVGRRRAGHALAHAAFGAAESAGYRADGLQVAIQGFGNLGRSAAESLVEGGATVIAVADEHGCAVDPRGLDIPAMLGNPMSMPVTEAVAPLRRLPRQALFMLPVDVLVLAAVENALTAEQAATLSVPVVVVGANMGITEAVEMQLGDRGVVVVPDFIGGIGGSASMETLYGPSTTPEPHEVLDGLAYLMRELTGDVLAGARQRTISPRHVALEMAANAVVSPDRRPYGSSPYSGAARRPKGNRLASAAARRSGLIATGENL